MISIYIWGGLDIVYPQMWYDTQDYIKTGASLFQNGIGVKSSHYKTIVYSFLIHALGTTSTLIIFQIVFYYLSFFALSVSITHIFKSIKPIYIHLIFIFISTSSYLRFWPHIFLSETIAISLFNLSISFLIFATIFNKNWGYRLLFLFFVLLFLWCRDSNLILGLGMIVIHIVSTPGLKYKLIIGILLVSFTLTNLHFMKVGQRGELPLANVILTRIAPNKTYSNWFQKQNCSIHVADSMHNTFAFEHNFQGFHALNPELRTCLSRTYTSFLIQHPGYVFKQFIRISNWKNLFAIDLQHFGGPEYTSQLDSYYVENYDWLVCILFILFTILYSLYSKKVNVVWWIIYVLSAIILTSVLVWHADSYEIARHNLIASYALRILTLVLILYILERVNYKKLFQFLKTTILRKRLA